MIELSIQKVLNFSNGVMPLDVQLNIKEGEFIGFYGSSGAGKTSLLRILAGLLEPDSGEIIINNTTWFSSKQSINLSPQRRQVGFVFQDYALFPNMTVKENLLFALKKGQNSNIIKELIELTELGSLQNIKPKLLSGGQQQRVALARALVQQPKLLLLDEPLSALDVTMRHQLQDYLLETHKSYGITTVLVSHDINELSRLVDKVVELKQGKVIGIHEPNEIFKRSKYHLKGRIVDIKVVENQYCLTVKIGENEVRVFRHKNIDYNINDFIDIIVDIQKLP
jgi:molybdate transport system ATP-binding protein